MNGHWSEDRLLDRLYGTAESDAHLDVCENCKTRLDRMRQTQVAQSFPQPSDEFLRTQRRRILGRATQPVPSLRAVWVPATLAFALMAGFWATRPAPAPVAPFAEQEAIMEAGWFEDTYSATRQLEPIAASPVRALFAEVPASQKAVLE